MQWPQDGELVDGQWRVIREYFPLNEQHIQRFYYVRHKDTNKLANCVIETTAVNVDIGERKWVEIYAKILKCSTHSHLPQCLHFGHLDNGIFVCTSLVGPSLEQLHDHLPEGAENRFSLHTALHIGFEILFALRGFHADGFLMRSMTPMSFGLSSTWPGMPYHGVVMMPNRYWSPQRWRSLDGSSAISLPYSSAGVCRLKDETRVDDLWSWFYILVRLTTGSLPWWPIPEYLQNFTVRAQCLWTANMKMEAANDPWDLLRSPSPPEYLKILKYLKSAPDDMGYNPDYDRLATLLRQANSRVAREAGGNPKLDWEPGGLYHEELRQALVIDQ